MKLGAFSISLAVKNIQESQEFYAKLGFEIVGGEQHLNWLIMRNDSTTIGLFQGMFEDNILTFNPGWDQNAKELESYSDVRELLAQCKEQGLTVTSETIESEQGPASFTLADPDGNTILIDQHV